MNKNEIVEILKDLELLRIRMEKGELTPGSADWVVRRCQAEIAHKYFDNRNEWTALMPEIYK